LRCHRKIDEKRDDEIVERTAPAIRRVGVTGRDRSYFRGFLSSLSFDSPPNFDGRRNLRFPRLALAKLDRDVCNRRSGFFSAP
jgi:hypothetical protein